MTRPARADGAPLPAGYRLAELDDRADRDAMLDVDRWAFASELTEEDEHATVWDLEPGRSVGVWDERDPQRPRLAAVHSSHAFALPVPGGTRVRTAGLTWVAVHPAHRRRGLSRAMLVEHLHRSVERGETLSALYAAETGIYGRYGYGQASQTVTMSLSRGVGLRDVPDAGDLVVDLERVGPEHVDVVRRVHGAVERPGWITRDTDALRRSRLVDLPSARRGTERLRIAVVRAADGEPRAFAIFRRAEKWSDADLPEGTVKVREAAALDGAASRTLWGTLADLDLMGSVATPQLAVDDPLVHLLQDQRGAAVRLHDDVWVRILDVPTALGERAYASDVDVVLEVRDPILPGNAGRWHLTGGPSGGAVRPTTAAPHLALGVAELGALYLGGTPLAALAAAGRVTVHDDGALAPTSTAFSWPVAPANSWVF